MTNPENVQTDFEAQLPTEALNPPHLLGRRTLYRDLAGIKPKNPADFTPDHLLGCTYVTSEQLSEIGDVETASALAAMEVGNNNSPRYFRELLRIVYRDAEIMLRQIQVGINDRTERPCLIYAFTKPQQEYVAIVLEGLYLEAKRETLAAQPRFRRIIRNLLRKRDER